MDFIGNTRLNDSGLFDVDLLGIISLYVGLVNLNENRQQTAHNDVSAANDKQAQYLLRELVRKFDEQNDMLKKILEVLHSEKSA